jgi:selenoprotein W-related protein
MALELLNTFGEWTDGITLVPGAGGAFELTVNGKQVYSKKATGTFPELNELKEAIQTFVK